MTCSASRPRSSSVGRHAGVGSESRRLGRRCTSSQTANSACRRARAAPTQRGCRCRTTGVDMRWADPGRADPARRTANSPDSRRRSKLSPARRLRCSHPRVARCRRVRTAPCAGVDCRSAAALPRPHWSARVPCAARQAGHGGGAVPASPLPIRLTVIARPLMGSSTGTTWHSASGSASSSPHLTRRARGMAKSAIRSKASRAARSSTSAPMMVWTWRRTGSTSTGEKMCVAGGAQLGVVDGKPARRAEAWVAQRQADVGVAAEDRKAVFGGVRPVVHSAVGAEASIRLVRIGVQCGCREVQPVRVGSRGDRHGISTTVHPDAGANHAIVTIPLATHTRVASSRLREVPVRDDVWQPLATSALSISRRENPCFRGRVVNDDVRLTSENCPSGVGKYGDR